MSVLGTKDDVKLYAPISATYAGYDTQIDKLIASVSDQIRQFCRRQFTLGAYTEFHRSACNVFKVFVNEPPIASASLTVSYDPAGRFIDTPVALTENTDYTVDYAKGVITFVSPLEYNPRGLRLTYNGGYAVTGDVVQVPAQITTALALQCAFLLQRLNAASVGVEETGSKRTEYAKISPAGSSGLISEAQALLDRKSLVGTM